MHDIRDLVAAAQEDLAALEADLETEDRSLYLGPGASEDEARKAARRRGIDTTHWRVEPRTSTTGGGLAFLRDVRAARLGDPSAFRRVSGAKGWVEGSDSAGGFLVPAQQLPGYLPARRAASPLRERCAHFDVQSNEIWIVTEGNSVTVQHVAEAATKPDSTGTVAQKVSTVFKVAGTSHVSDELLDDSDGNAAEIVTRQFAGAIGRAIDTAIISGTGTGEPTGIRNAAGVTSRSTKLVRVWRRTSLPPIPSSSTRAIS
jgi:HK97 family phage major capsid protein